MSFVPLPLLRLFVALSCLLPGLTYGQIIVPDTVGNNLGYTFVEVGDPQNPDDDETTSRRDLENAGYGYVGQLFAMGRTEVSNAMYARFLNAVAKRDRLYGLYTTAMGNNTNGGIVRSGASGSYTYTVKAGFALKPVNFVSVFDAMRFCNWLHNGMPGDPQAEDPARRTPLTGDQDASSTEDGAYTLLGANGDEIVRRNVEARYYLPDQDEWHKAAFYDPNPGIDPVTGLLRPSESYWEFADQTSNGPGGNFVVDSSDNSLIGPLADVASSAGASHYGTHDQDGNVNEWLDATITESSLVRRLCARTTFAEVTYSAEAQRTETDGLGFRVAKRLMPASTGLGVPPPLMVEVGQTNNLADEEFSPLLGDPKLGAVNYTFQMGAYEVTNLEYARFLNAKATSKAVESFYRLYDTRMATDSANGGITRTELPDGKTYEYGVKRGFARKPVVYVSIYSAMRYCNWLHNGGRANDDMEAGAYRLLGNVPPNTENLTRNATARYYLPNANEFYKAAYYDKATNEPAKTLAEATFNYWKFATRSDTFDTNNNSSNLADVDFSSVTNYFGTRGQSGNVGYDVPGVGKAAPAPNSDNTGEWLETGTNSPAESPTTAFRIAAAQGMGSLRPDGDQDNDGLKNGWEVLNDLNHVSGAGDNGATGDPDRDGLFNSEEQTAKTDPKDSDTDIDDLSDFAELRTWFTDPKDADTDNDGLLDGAEVNTHTTDPKDADTDNDGLSDGAEIKTHGSNPKLADTDGDELGDAEEVNVHKTIPTNPDTDGDGMKDGWEVQYEFDPKDQADAALDADGDGLTNLQEFDAGSDPRDNDTDGDGMPDKWEVDFGLKPADPNDAAPDRDEPEPDGLSNLEEYTAGTNPKIADTDGDGMPDGWEVEYGLNPLVDDGGQDADGDELGNFDEYKAATLPNNPDTDGDLLTDGAEVKTHGTKPLLKDTDGDGLTDYQELSVFGTNPLAATPIPKVPVFRVVADPQNPDDDRGANDVQNAGLGYVGQEFGISVTEVTNEMYALFLNSIAKRDRLYGLYRQEMGDHSQGGILRSGTQGSYTYSVKNGFATKPVNFVSLWDVLRYINWLHNWKVRDPLMRLENRPVLTGSQDQDASTTEDGVYALRGTNPENFTRHPAAQFFLPDVDEWHKAAYYDPDPGNGRPAESYWDWATQKMNPPTNEGLEASTTPLVAVGTAVGDYFGPSHYGTFDQDGNVEEWVQDALILGGRKTSTATRTSEIATLGFRVAQPVVGATVTQETVPLAVEVGQPGNLADEEFAPEFGDGPIGAVGYTFQMGAYEVTNREYTKFLNAKAKEDSFYRLYDTRMGSDAVNGGIERSGANGNYAYKVKTGFATKPVVYVSIYSAMRYCNWLHNGGRADSDMEAGAYRLLGNIPTDRAKLTRNATARYYLPNANEFYKAAYYDPSSLANATFDYWKFATRSDTFDTNNNANTLANVDFSSMASYFGTYGQSGNVGYQKPGATLETPRSANTGEWLEEADNSGAELATRTFRIAAAAGMPALRPLGDEDSDGMSNAYEVFNDLDPRVNDAAEDPDEDGLTNLQESKVGTDPKVEDTDKDGLLDGDEVGRGTNPLNRDTDGDTLTDGDEVNRYGTDPKKADTDGDGFADNIELQQLVTNPLVADNEPFFVRVGDPGNPDEDDASQDLENDGMGHVGQQFDIGMTEVTNTMYAKFLNAVAKSDSLYGLYSTFMGSDPSGGIIRKGSSGNYRYEVKPGYEGRPVNFVSAFDAMRYCNWLHNGSLATGVQNASTTEDGVYPLRGKNQLPGVKVESRERVRRSFGAKYFLPDEDEWHKAAYYDPELSVGLPSDSYWPYADQTTAGPGGNYGETRNRPVASSSGRSHYGTFDQDGNLEEWTESTIVNGSELQIRRGSLFDQSDNPENPGSIQGAPAETERAVLGFRIARAVTPAAVTQDVLPRLVAVGSPRNVPDLEGKGAVDYEFQIGAYEVTNAEYAAFLNAVAADDSVYRLYDIRMGTGLLGGIDRFGSPGAYTYAAKTGFANKPVNYVTFFNALRYCNWLHNGAQPQGNTEFGAYRLLGGLPFSTGSIRRNFGARYFLPNEDEWHKAAYYDPSSDAASVGNYWDYAIRSQSPRFGQIVTAGLTGLAEVSKPGIASYFGTYGQNGNAAEWVENIGDGDAGDVAERLVLGGGLNSDWASPDEAVSFFADPTKGVIDRGFRIAARVEAPSTRAVATQTIKFSKLPAKRVLGTKPLKIRLRATTTSKLKPEFVIDDPGGIATYVDGKVPYLLVTKPGTLKITARQPGLGRWAAAEEVQQTIEIVPRVK